MEDPMPKASTLKNVKNETGARPYEKKDSSKIEREMVSSLVEKQSKNGGKERSEEKVVYKNRGDRDDRQISRESGKAH